MACLREPIAPACRDFGKPTRPVADPTRFVIGAIIWTTRFGFTIQAIPIDIAKAADPYTVQKHRVGVSPASV